MRSDALPKRMPAKYDSATARIDFAEKFSHIRGNRLPYWPVWFSKNRFVCGDIDASKSLKHNERVHWV
jgi:hypothetical protein